MSIQLKPYLTGGIEPDEVPDVIFDLERSDRLLDIRFTITGLADRFEQKRVIGSRRSELWLETCFECFLGSSDSKAYTEFNFAPSGDWQCFSFDRYRERMRPSETWSPVEFSMTTEAEGAQHLCARMTSTGSWPSSIKVQGAAIIVWQGTMLYYASTHGERPDFHHPDYFLEGAIFGL